CSRKHVGAVIVRDRTVLSTGYNGSLRGMPHCEDVGCIMEDGHCVTTVHAEANAILQAAKNGVSIEGSELYTTASPCWNCFKLIANAGIKRIYFGEFYRDERSREVAAQIGIDLVDLGMPAPVAVVGDAGRGEFFISIYDNGREVVAPRLASSIERDELAKSASRVINVAEFVQHRNVATNCARRALEIARSNALDRYSDITPIY